MKQIKLPSWKNKTILEKVLTILTIIFAFGLLIVCILKIIDKWFISDTLYQVILSLMLFTESFLYYKHDKGAFYYLLIFSIFSLVILIISILI